MTETCVFITVDTEHSIGGAFKNPLLKPVGNDMRIYGRQGGKEFGIPLMMDIADNYGISLTFFVEVFNKYYFGESETGEVCEYILKRGHDVQLHLHPGWLNFRNNNPAEQTFSDQMSDYDVETQIQLIHEGRELIKKYCGYEPVAFRAGNYSADRNTLKALKMNKILIDSSYNAAFIRHSTNMSTHQMNDAIQIEGIWEFPITNFIESIPLFKNRLKPLDINGVSFLEIKQVLEQACFQKNPRYISLILHSFSFLKPKTVQYQNCTVRKYVIRRFEKVCRYLAANHNMLTHLTYNQISGITHERKGNFSEPVFSRMPPRFSLLRAIEQQLG